MPFVPGNPHYICQHLGVVGQKIVYELQRISCIELEEVQADKQNICCSRSFGKVTSDFNAIREATVIRKRLGRIEMHLIAIRGVGPVKKRAIKAIALKQPVDTGRFLLAAGAIPTPPELPPPGGRCISANLLMAPLHPPVGALFLVGRFLAFYQEGRFDGWTRSESP
jgi:hypothetical protein